MPFAPESQIELSPPYVLTYQHPVTSNRVNGLGTNQANGGGAPTHVANPDGGSDLVIRTRAASNNAESELIFNMAYLPTDWDLQGIQAPQEEFDDLLIEARLRLDWQGIAALPTRIQGIFSFLNEAGTTRIGSVAMANGGRIRVDDSVTGNSSTAGAEITEDTWHTITARYKASTGATDGLIQVWVDGDSKIVHVHNNTTQVGRTGCGSRNVGFGANNIDLFIRHVAFVRQSTLDRFSDLQIGSLMVTDPGMGILLDVSGDSVSIGCHWHPSVHNDAWRTANDVVFDVEYVAGTYDDQSFPGSGTTITSTVALPSASEWCGVQTVTGLTEGAWSARCRAYSAAAGPGSAYIGPVLNFKTLPSTAGVIRIAPYFCQQPEFYGHVHPKLIASQSIDFAVSEGDEFYNDSTPQASTHPSGTKQSFLRALLHVFIRNPFKALQSRRVPTFMLPDDHDVCENNWHQGYVLGFSTAYNLAGDSGGDRLALADDAILAGAGYTKGNVYDAGGQAWHDLIAKGYLNPAYAGTAWHDRAHHRKIVMPNCLGLAVDSRRFQSRDGNDPFCDGSNPTFLGPHQMDWLQAEIAAWTGAGLILFSPSNLSDLHVINDGWHSESAWQAELHTIEGWIMANAFIEWVYYVSGDRHATAMDRRNKDGQYGRSGTSFPKLVASIRIGPAGAGAVPSFFGETITEDVDFVTTFGSTAAGRPAKGFGVLELDTRDGRMTVQAISSDTGAAVFSKTYAPAGASVAPAGIRSRAQGRART